MSLKNRVNLFFTALLFLSSCSSHKHLSRENSNVKKKYATMMDVSTKRLHNNKLYNFINEWEGVKYRNGGLNKTGIDCSGFVYLLYKEVYNKEIPRNTSQQINIIKRKFEGSLKEGDLVFFDYDNKKFSHVGVFLQNGYYVHASTRRGVMVQKLKDPYTYKYFSRGGSIR
ncbi:NLP/P60 protein [Pseudopedobacter saltans DSM 12145]|uniref:NLP/P60 protein n=2 Tax=Pseudopedobacter saltans TaxID=151895 RepID=F0SD22_PSESL|nr:NLP/P60 protein [Pseudopedobacter saltans DSM 12145]